MLIRQAGVNLAANVMSALLGLLSVSIFTRLFSPRDYGTYLLGVGFAAVVGVFLVGWFRNLVLSGHARNDGTDVRGLVLAGYLLWCLTTPVVYAADCRSDWTGSPHLRQSYLPSPSACSN